MKNIKIDLGIYIMLLLFVLVQSCGKKWLEEKPDKSLVVPENINDFQLVLDDYNIFNVNQSIGLGEIAAGDFYITFSAWQSLFTVQEKSAYIWAPTSNFYNGEQSVDWVNAYERILKANIVLDGIAKITPADNEQQDWSNVKGSALFFRAFDFFNLAQEYCVSFNQATANTDLGLPLRLTYDVNIQIKRSTLQQTYERIINDVKASSELLSVKPQHKTRPSKEAAYALLARIYLVMGYYDDAGKYADLVLKIQSELLDYNKLNSSASFPVTRFNREVIFHSLFSYGIFGATKLTVEPGLYSTYSTSDLRKTMFFTSNANGMTFKGNYSGDRSLFGGFAVDEIYLIRAEARARNGAIEDALADLNRLRRSRWRGNYQDLSSEEPKTVLDYVLAERRIELAFRGIRWMDLRRLNKDAQYAVTLTRTLNGITYTLTPGDKRVVFPIDEEELRLSGITQNQR